MKRSRKRRQQGHIRQQGKRTFQIKLHLGSDPITGTRRTEYHTFVGTKDQAQRELRRMLEALADGTYAKPERLTLAEYLRERWLPFIRTQVRAKTAERYSQIVEHHLVPSLGQYQLAALQPVHISDAWAAALREGRRRTMAAKRSDAINTAAIDDGAATGAPSKPAGLSAQTVKHHHRVLSQALKCATRWRLLARSPTADVDPPRPPRTEMTILSPEETKQLLAAISHTRTYLPVLLAVTTGMRRGEVLGLRWRDVDLDAAKLSVTQTLEQTEQGLSFQQPKTARSRRQIALSRMTVEALRHHRAEQAKELLAAGLGRDPDALVITTKDGGPLQPRSLTHEFTRLVAKAGVPRIRFHDLRHTHLSHLLLNNIHPKVASERAGHASVAITMDVYSHVLPGMQEEAAALID
jgi:integrase